MFRFVTTFLPDQRNRIFPSSIILFLLKLLIKVMQLNEETIYAFFLPFFLSPPPIIIAFYTVLFITSAEFKG